MLLSGSLCDFVNECFVYGLLHCMILWLIFLRGMMALSCVVCSCWHSSGLDGMVLCCGGARSTSANKISNSFSSALPILWFTWEWIGCSWKSTSVLWMDGRIAFFSSWHLSLYSTCHLRLEISYLLTNYAFISLFYLTSASLRSGIRPGAQIKTW